MHVMYSANVLEGSVNFRAYTCTDTYNTSEHGAHIRFSTLFASLNLKPLSRSQRSSDFRKLAAASVWNRS